MRTIREVQVHPVRLPVTSTLRGHLGPAVTGTSVSDRWLLHRRMHAAIGRGPRTGQPVARAALDMAVHDLCARAAGLPLRCLLGGGESRRTVQLSYTVTADEPDPAALAELAVA